MGTAQEKTKLVMRDMQLVCESVGPIREYWLYVPRPGGRSRTIQLTQQQLRDLGFLIQAATAGAPPPVTEGQ